MEDLYKEAMLDVRKTNNRILILSRLKDEESKKIAFAEKKEYEEKGYVVEVLDISKEYIGLRDYTLKNTLKLENIVKELNLDKVGKPFFELLSSGFKNSIIKKVESYDANVVLATDEEIMRLVYLSKITDEIDITFLTITTKYIKDTL